MNEQLKGVLLIAVGVFIMALVFPPMFIIIIGVIIGAVVVFGTKQPQPHQHQEDEQEDVDELFRQWRRDKEDAENNRRR